jgi:hypothetical protein
MEHADEVVDGRVLRPLLVAVVELVVLRDAEPARLREHEEENGSADVRDGDAALSDAEDELDGEERDRQAGDVGEEERPADEPAPPVARIRPRAHGSGLAHARRVFERGHVRVFAAVGILIEDLRGRH